MVIRNCEWKRNDENEIYRVKKGYTIMSEVILRTKELTKEYNSKVAIENVSIQIESGKIYGFIGENGAGKTTTIRLITGLAEATSGTIEMFGVKSKKGLENARRRIGCLVEKPILAFDKTAYENMRLQNLLYGKRNKDKIGELLERVGLDNVHNKKVKDFSLGMKQRLGIAMALVQEPDLLVLDEPVNGLDPMGMIDVRELLRSLNEKDGITILISSHILTELYQLVTDYVIISNGKIVEQITGEELEKKCSKHILIESDRIKDVVQTLKEKLDISEYEVSGHSLKLYDCVEDIRSVAQAIFEAGILLTRLTIIGKSLEEYYMDLLGRN